MAHLKPPETAQARERFSELVRERFLALNNHKLSYDNGVTDTRQIIEETATRAALSSEPGSELVEQVLRCVLAQIDREICD